MKKTVKKKTTKKTRPAPPPPPDGRQLACVCARIADDYKCENIVVLDVEKTLAITDCFVIATAPNFRTMRSIADEMKHKMVAAGLRGSHLEAASETNWMLIDFGALVVHLFDANSREYYDLEFLWSDAPRIEWKLPVAEAAAAEPAEEGKKPAKPRKPRAKKAKND